MLGGKIYCYYPMGSRGVINPPPCGGTFQYIPSNIKRVVPCYHLQIGPRGKKVAIQQEEKNHVFFTWDLFLDLDLT